DRQRLFAGRAGDRPVDVGEAAPALLIPGPDLGRDVFGGVGHAASFLKMWWPRASDLGGARPFGQSESVGDGLQRHTGEVRPSTAGESWRRWIVAPSERPDRQAPIVRL